MNIFYVQNENQFKKIILYLVKNEMVEDIDELAKIGFLGCDYIKNIIPNQFSFDPYEQNCNMCELGDCYLFGKHENDIDVISHMYMEQEIEYPFIFICIPSTSGFEPIILETITIHEAKENTRCVTK